MQTNIPTTTLPARQGLKWLTEGVALFRKRPWAFMLLFNGYWLCTALINMIPGVGIFVVSILSPLLLALMMSLCRQLITGRPIDLDASFVLLRQSRAGLFYLGAAYIVFFMLALGISAAVDGGLFAQTLLGLRQPEPEDMNQDTFRMAVYLNCVLLLPAMMAWSFAPLLVAWQNFSAGKALFFSFMVYLRYWRLFCMYALGLLVFGLLLPMLLMTFLLMLVPAGFSLWLVFFAGFYALFLAPVALISFYLSYCQIFAVDSHAMAA